MISGVAPCSWVGRPLRGRVASVPACGWEPMVKPLCFLLRGQACGVMASEQHLTNPSWQSGAPTAQTEASTSGAGRLGLVSLQAPPARPWCIS